MSLVDRSSTLEELEMLMVDGWKDAFAMLSICRYGSTGAGPLLLEWMPFEMDEDEELAAAPAPLCSIKLAAGLAVEAIAVAPTGKGWLCVPS